VEKDIEKKDADLKRQKIDADNVLAEKTKEMQLEINKRDAEIRKQKLEAETWAGKAKVANHENDRKTEEIKKLKQDFDNSIGVNTKLLQEAKKNYMTAQTAFDTAKLPYANGNFEHLDAIMKNMVKELQNLFPKTEKADDDTNAKILAQLVELVKALQKLSFDPKYSTALESHLSALLLLFKDKDQINKLQNYIAAETEKFNRLLLGTPSKSPGSGQKRPAPGGGDASAAKKSRTTSVNSPGGSPFVLDLNKH